MGMVKGTIEIISLIPGRSIAIKIPPNPIS